MSTPRFRKLRRFAWYLAVGGLIAAAVLLTLARLLLPQLDSYRPTVADWVGARLGQPVAIGTMDVRLSGLTPTLVLKNVRLLGRHDHRVVARFTEADLGLAPFASLWRGRPVIGRLTVSGAALTVERARDGHIRVQGMHHAAASADAAALGRWLLDQGRLVLRNSRVDWHDRQGHIPDLDLKGVTIDLTNDGDLHRLDAVVALPPSAGRRLRLTARIEGNPLRRHGWDGELYLEGRGVTPHAWMNQLHFGGVRLERGRIDLQLWGHWHDGRLQRVRADGTVRDLAFAGAGPAAHWSALGAKVLWHRAGNGWRVAVDDLKVARDGRQWPATWLRAAVGPGGAHLRASYLRLGDLAPLARLLPALDARHRRLLAALAPRGVLRAVRVDLGPGGQRHLQAILQGVSSHAHGAWPGVEGLSGRAVWSSGSGELQVASRNTALNLPKLFRAPLRFAHLSGRVGLFRRTNGWLVSADHVDLGNGDIQATADMRLALPAAGSPFLDLHGRFRGVKATAVPRYLPAHHMHPDAVAWLDHAFKAGTATRGEVLFHGPVRDFPFDHGRGRFEVRFQARGVDLAYRKGWPDLTGVDGTVDFSGRRMHIEARAGKLLGSTLGSTTADIPDLDKPLLVVDGDAQLAAADGLHLLFDTPLRAHFGQYGGTAYSASGQAKLALKLAIPLSPKVAARHRLMLAGRLVLENDRLQVDGAPPVQGLSGALHFTGERIEGSGLRGRMLGSPVQFAVTTGRGKGGVALTRVRARGRLQVGALRRLWHGGALSALSGGAAWNATLSLPHPGTGTGVTLALRSDLRGVTSTLPAPLQKGAKARRSLTIDYRLSGPRAGWVTARYGDRLAARAHFSGGQLAAAALRFGKGAVPRPPAGTLLVTGSASGLDLSGWGPFFSNGGKGPRLAVEVAMERLALREPDHAPGKPSAGSALDDISRLKVAIKHFAYGGLNLGQLAFHTTRRAQLLLIQDLTLKGDHYDLQGHGAYLADAPTPHTELTLDLSSNDVGAMMKSLGFASVISKGAASVQANLQWPGPPAAARLAHLGGSLHLRVKDGTMVDVKPGAGRLIGLLSLQALPRRLRLDFRDLFQKGLSFSNIDGDFSLSDGNAYTDNLRMEAPSANMLITGRTGLAARDYDQVITVIPNVGSSLPVAGGLALGPQVGAALLIVQKLFGSEINDVAKTQYRVTGTWEKPVVQKVTQPMTKKPASSAADTAVMGGH